MGRQLPGIKLWIDDVDFADELPKTASGKIRRAALRGEG